MDDQIVQAKSTQLRSWRKTDQLEVHFLWE